LGESVGVAGGRQRLGKQQEAPENRRRKQKIVDQLRQRENSDGIGRGGERGGGGDAGVE